MSEISPSKVNRSRFVYDQSASGRLPSNSRNESSEYTITVKHIPANITRQAIIDFASKFGTLTVEPHITQSTDRLQRIAFLTFTEQSAVQRCMNGARQKYTIGEHLVVVQRWLPVGLTFDRSYRLLLFLETNSSDCTLNENDIRTYFNTHYGQTKAFSWTSNIVATIDFEDYDSIDRAILTSVNHTINGVKVRLEKVKSSIVRAAHEQTIAPHSIQFCVHVRNVPSHVGGEQLANIFSSNVWDVLIRKGTHPDKDPFEAWIINIPTMADAEQLAAAVKFIDKVDVQCDAEKEPLNEWTLCSGNRDGWCKHGNDCIYRHVTCTSGDECKNEKCPFSHSKQRNIVPNPRYRPAGPIEQQYRIKIDGLPNNMTAMQLLTELKKQPLNLLKSIETPEVPEGSKTRHFYLVRQAAEKLARKRVYEWHDYPIRESYLVKCQLEYDRAPITELPSNSSSSSNTVLQTDNQRLRSLFAPLSPGDEEIYGMPSEWIWTNRRLGRMISDVYLVYPFESTDDRLGAMKVYRDQSDLESMRARRELLALRALENELAVISVYESNILDVTRKKDAPMWIITQLISEITLEDFINKHKSEITFHKALLLIRQLLEIVQQCHKLHVFHRNLLPSNIIVQQNNDHASIDEIKLVLIDFGLAWIDNQELSLTDEDDLKMLDQVIQRHANNDLKQPSNNVFCLLQHLQSPSWKSQRCSSTIDSTDVCRILFWLLTDKWPDRVYYTNTYPHYENEYQQKIHEKLGDALSNTKLCEQVMLIFDRTFGSLDHWWSVDELLNHLNMIDALFVEFEIAQLNILFPITTTTTLLPFSDLYARIVALIARVKQQFAEQHSTCIKWSDVSNKWSTKNKDIEVINTDELIYDYQKRHCTVPIIFSAKIESDQTKLFLGSSTKDGTIELKPLCNLTKETNDVDVSIYFDNVVKKLVKEKLKQACSSP